MFLLSVGFYALALFGSVSAIVIAPKFRRDGAQLITSCTVPNTAALTFDDGPHIYMREIVDTLKAVGGKGTFFVNGDNWSCIFEETAADNLKYAYDNGFQIGSHTWSHKDLSTLSRDELIQEMSRTEEAIQKITGAIPAFTRPPFGSYSDDALDVAGSRSQTVVIWDLDSEDSIGSDLSRQKQMYDDGVGRHPNNILSLQHETYDTTVHDVLPYAINALQSAGYQLVTLAECLGQSPYLSVGEPSQRGDDWQCYK